MPQLSVLLTTPALMVSTRGRRVTAHKDTSRFKQLTINNSHSPSGITHLGLRTAYQKGLCLPGKIMGLLVVLPFGLPGFRFGTFGSFAGCFLGLPRGRLPRPSSRAVPAIDSTGGAVLEGSKGMICSSKHVFIGPTFCIPFPISHSPYTHAEFNERCGQCEEWPGRRQQGNGGTSTAQVTLLDFV